MKKEFVNLFFLLFSVDDPPKRWFYKNIKILFRAVQQTTSTCSYTQRPEAVEVCTYARKFKCKQQIEKSWEERSGQNKNINNVSGRVRCVCDFIFAFVALSKPASLLTFRAGWLCVASFNHNPFDIYNRQTNGKQKSGSSSDATQCDLCCKRRGECVSDTRARWMKERLQCEGFARTSVVLASQAYF